MNTVLSSYLVLLSLLIRVESLGNEELLKLREEVREMFYHGYTNYMEHAFPADELKPLACEPRDRNRESRGHLDDSLGDFSLTLVDSLDTLVVLGDIEGFEKGLYLLVDTLSFEKDVTVSVFETTIRVLGGLLSIHLLAKEHSASFKRPYVGDEILWLAEDLGNRLLLAFDTPTGIPYSRVNLMRGVPSREVPETCTAGAGTLMLEFGVLSKLTGKPEFEEAALNAMRQLWEMRSDLDLMGNTLNIFTGRWIDDQSSIGAGIDSFYEYLLKSYILFGDREFFDMFNATYTAVSKYLKVEGWYLNANMHTAYLTRDWVDSLQAFWPGLQVLYGDVNEAIQSHRKLHSIWESVGFLPEGYNIRVGKVMSHSAGYPLRPEFVESTLLLYQATKDPFYLEVGKQFLRSLQDHTRVPCGFASISNVITKNLEDRMDSFFLSETLKYLYLLFDVNNTFNTADRIFTTEAHIFPLSFRSDASHGQAIKGDCQVPAKQELFAILETPTPPATVNEGYCAQEDAAQPTTTFQIRFTESPQVHGVVRVRSPPMIESRFRTSLAMFGPVLSVKGISGRLAATDPPLACTKIANAHELAGRIAVIERGGCTFMNKVWQAWGAGAIGAIIVNNQPSLFTMSGDPNLANPPIPAVMISQSDGKRLMEHLDLVEVEVFASEPYSQKELDLPVKTPEVSLNDEPPVIFIQNPGEPLSQEQLTEWILEEVRKYGLKDVTLSVTDVPNPPNSKEKRP